MSTYFKVLITVSVLVLTRYTSLSAQEAPTWKYEFSHNLNWSFKDSKSGIYFGYGENTFTAFDYVHQKELWSINLPGLKSDNIYRYKGDPVVLLSGLNSSKKGLMTSRRVLLNFLTGAILFDTDDISEMTINDIYAICDAGIAILKGRKDKERVYGLVRFGEKTTDWIQPLPVKLKKITARDVVKPSFRACDEHLVFGYADKFFSVDQKDGSIVWEKTKLELNYSGMIQKSKYLRVDDPYYYMVKLIDGDYQLNAFSPKDGAPIWETNFNLGKNYRIVANATSIFYKGRNTFNYLDFETGKAKWDSPPTFQQTINKVYEKGDKYAILFKDGEQIQSFSWVDAAGNLLLEKPITIRGGKLRLLKEIDNRIVYFTDLEAGVVNLENMQSSNHTDLLNPQTLFALDSTKQEIGIYLDGQLQVLNYKTGAYKTIFKKIKFKGKEEVANSIRSTDQGYAILSDRTYWHIDAEGNVLAENYYKEESSFDFKKLAVNVGGWVAGALIGQDEMMQITQALYEEELIDSEEAFNHQVARAAYGRVGGAAVGSTYTNQLYDALYGNQNARKAAASFLSNRWILPDKLDKKAFGLRVIDTNSGTEKQQIVLSKNSFFQYEILAQQKGFFLVDKNILNFYQFQ